MTPGMTVFPIKLVPKVQSKLNTSGRGQAVVADLEDDAVEWQPVGVVQRSGSSSPVGKSSRSPVATGKSPTASSKSPSGTGGSPVASNKSSSQKAKSPVGGKSPAATGSPKSVSSPTLATSSSLEDQRKSFLAKSVKNSSSTSGSSQVMTKKALAKQSQMMAGPPTGTMMAGPSSRKTSPVAQAYGSQPTELTIDDSTAREIHAHTFEKMIENILVSSYLIILSSHMTLVFAEGRRPSAKEARCGEKAKQGPSRYDTR